ncbi:hypothetical protein HY501_00700, partial [Candidatus Woesearchaeota archaeon]|nr:hypothetical protein [Candidatus Woesearchaeota archaeon]
MKRSVILLAILLVFISYSTLSIAQLSFQDACVEGSRRPCGSNIGQCQAGIRVCTNGQWGECAGNVGPSLETCDGVDNNCNSQVDEDACSPTQCADGASRPCGSNIGECEAGVRICTGGSWGECTGSIAPSQETCDGKDNNCNAVVDDACALVQEQPPEETQPPKSQAVEQDFGEAALIIQFGAVIGQPVKWKVIVKPDKKGEFRFEIPKEAENIDLIVADETLLEDGQVSMINETGTNAGNETQNSTGFGITGGA